MAEGRGAGAKEVVLSEYRIQCAVATYLNNQERLFKRFTWFHPTTWSKDRRQGGKMKAAGSKAGIPDCCILTEHGGTIFIELKAIKGSLRPEQRTFHEKLSSLTHPVYVVKAEFPHEAVNQVEAILKKEEVLS